MTELHPIQPQPTCPICRDPLGSVPVIGYVLKGERVMTCSPCRETLMNVVLEVKLGRRQAFLGKSNDTEKMRERIHRAVLEARGLKQ